MENESTELSLAAHSEMVKERADHQPVVIFTKDNMGEDKPVTVVIIPPVRFIGAPQRHDRIGSTQGSWDPERSVAVITTLRIPVDEALADIGIKTRNGVIHMTCSSPRYPLRSHSLVCIENHLFIVGIGPILNKELGFIFRSDRSDRTCVYS